MPLSRLDRRFVNMVARLKGYLFILAMLVLCYTWVTPPSEIHTITYVLAIVLCFTFWLVQRMLSLITIMDAELNRALDVLKHAIPPSQLESLDFS